MRLPELMSLGILLLAAPATAGSDVTSLPSKLFDLPRFTVGASTRPVLQGGRPGLHGRGVQGRVLLDGRPATPLDGALLADGLRWIAVDGETLEVAFDVPVDLLDLTLIAPPGAWVELEILVADTPWLAWAGSEAAGEVIALPAEGWVVPLAHPSAEGAWLHLELDLPGALLEDPTDPTLAAAVLDGALIVQEER